MNTLLLAAAFAGAVVAPPASARSIVVQTSDVDFSSPAGRAALDARIARAARHACAADDVRSLAQMSAARRCALQAVDATRPQLAALEARKGMRRG